MALLRVDVESLPNVTHTLQLYPNDEALSKFSTVGDHADLWMHLN
jgi:hypothetical protein